MDSRPAPPLPTSTPHRLATLYGTGVRTVAVLLPLAGIAYLRRFSDPAGQFHHFVFHEIVILVAVLLSAFVAWVSFLNYRHSGEPLLRFWALAYLGFAVVYLPHALLTRASEHHLASFLIFGPASRLVMAAYLLAGIVRFGPGRENPRGAFRWWPHLLALVMAGLCLLIGSWTGVLETRWIRTIEGTVIALLLGSIMLMLVRRIGRGLMHYHFAALVLFVQASVAFLLSRPWNHTWWFGHAVFAAGFLVSSYGIIRAYLTTRSLAVVYTEEELLAELNARGQNLEEANRRLAEQNRELQQRAEIIDQASDAITVRTLDDRVVFWNRGAERLYGWPAREALGTRQPELLHTAFEGPAADAKEELRRGGSWSGEVDRTTRGGDRLVVAVHWTLLESDGPEPKILEISHDVTERRRAQEQALELALERAARAEAESARAHAEAANQAKSAFLANTSHEIRTPINAIIGYTELLEMEIAGPVNPAQHEHVARIRASSSHLLVLINDVLDLAKIEAGHVAVQRERAVTQEAVQAAMGLVGPQAAERGIEIEDACAKASPAWYYGDDARVRQILVNLLSNAVKFTGQSGRITVSCGTTEHPDDEARLAREAPWTFVRVSDTGVGVAPEKLETVFDAFVQVDSGHPGKQGGTGLGLTISRELARLMGGDLTAWSEVGSGSVFTLWLPAA